jgi:ferredoxin
MASWFYRGLRRGIVTTHYPKRLDQWAAALPSPPAFHPQRLTVDLVDRLVNACASSALSRDDGELVIDLGKCTSCGRCIDLADGAAEPSGEPLLASVARQTLIKTVPIRGGDPRRG